MVQPVDDWRVTARQFVTVTDSLLRGIDQAYADQDAYVGNPTRQFVTVGPNAVAVEGSPLRLVATSQGVAMSPALLVVLAVVGYLALRRRG